MNNGAGSGTSSYKRYAVHVKSQENLNIQVPCLDDLDSVKSETLKRGACKILGIEEDKWKYFQLVRGEHPCTEIKPDSYISRDDDDIFLQPWVFQNDEILHIMDDKASVHLLVNNIVYEVGNLQNNLPKEYLNMISEIMREKDEVHSLQRLKSAKCLCLYKFACQTRQNFPDCQSPIIHRGASIHLFMMQHFILIIHECSIFYVSWTKLKSWKFNHKTQEIQFEVVNMKSYKSSWLDMKLTHDQTYFALSVLSEYIFSLQKLESAEVGFFASNFLKRSSDELHLLNPVFNVLNLDNLLFFQNDETHEEDIFLDDAPNVNWQNLAYFDENL